LYNTVDVISYNTRYRDTLSESTAVHGNDCGLCRTLFPEEMQDLTFQLLDMADVHPDSRSFALSVEDFNRLCLAYEKLCVEHPGLFEYDFRYNKIALSEIASHSEPDEY